MGCLGGRRILTKIVGIEAGQRSAAEKAELQKYYRENVSPLFAKIKEELAG